MRKAQAIGLCVVMAFVVAGAGCRRGGEDRLRQGDRMVTAIISDPKTFNPLISVDSASSEALAELFDGLVRMNPKTTLTEPQLAKSWEHDEAGTTR